MYECMNAFFTHFMCDLPTVQLLSLNFAIGKVLSKMKKIDF